MKHRRDRWVDPPKASKQHPERIHAEREDENALSNHNDQLSRQP